MNFGGYFTGVKSPPKFKFHIRNIIVCIRNIIVCIRNIIVRIRNIIVRIRNIILRIRNMHYTSYRQNYHSFFISTLIFTKMNFGGHFTGVKSQGAKIQVCKRIISIEVETPQHQDVS